MRRKNYSDLLKDPRWQKKRLEVLERAGWRCEACGRADSTLHCHHGYYEKNLLPWEYDSLTLWCLCEGCHELTADYLRDVYFEIAHINPGRLSPNRILGTLEPEDMADSRRRGDLDRAGDGELMLGGWRQALERVSLFLRSPGPMGVWVREELGVAMGDGPAAGSRWGGLSDPRFVGF